MYTAPYKQLAPQNSPTVDSVMSLPDSVADGHPGLNLKISKMNYCLGTLDPDWATHSKVGTENFSRSGQNEFIHGHRLEFS